MPSIHRRAFLAGSTAVLSTVAGCAALDDSRPAHTVSVYLGDRDATREVTVTVLDGTGETLFERSYRLSAANEADEDATFPASTDPETVVVVADGTRFERGWPGVEHPELPCEGGNRAGIEVSVEGAPDEPPSLRLDANCQSVTTN